MSNLKLLCNKAQALFLLLLAASLLVSCSRDGRELRVAGPGQGESIAIVTTTVELVANEQQDVAQEIFTVSGTWLDSGAIDPRHTCLGSNISPSLNISNSPANAASLAITLIDLENPEKPLWVVANINPTETLIQEGAVPAEAIVGATTNGTKVTTGYSGPCPTGSEIHEYLLVVYALDQTLEFTPDPISLPDSQLLFKAIQTSAFDSTETRFFAQTT